MASIVVSMNKVGPSRICEHQINTDIIVVSKLAAWEQITMAVMWEL